MILLIIIPLISGCSDNTYTSETFTVSPNANPMVYVPLEQGFRVNYANLEPTPSYFYIEVGQAVNIAGNPGHLIKRVDQTSNEVTVFYRYRKNNSIYESYNINNPGYRILQSPFVTGHSWSLFDTSGTAVATFNNQDSDNDIPGDGTDFGDGKDDYGFWGGGYFKDKPGIDYNTMRIVGFEDVQSLNGRQYGNCLKVAWQTDPLHTSYYWYYPDVGLVKYEHGFNTINNASNHTVGVMTDFQKVEY
jgi:hypothetical protein